MAPINIFKKTYDVNSVSSGYQIGSNIVGLSNGNYLVVWSDDNDNVAGGNGYDVVGQLYDAFGKAKGGTFYLNDGYKFDRQEQEPAVAATADGGFALTYVHRTGNEGDQQYRRFDDEGNALNNFDKTVYNDSSSGSDTIMEVGIEHRVDGSSVVLYQLTDGNDSDLKATIINANGNQTTVNVQNDSDTNSTNGNLIDPAMAMMQDGSIIMAWTKKNESDYDIQFRMMNSGNGLSSVVTAGSLSSQNGDVDVTGLSGGGWVLTWRSGTEILSRIYNSDGDAVGGEKTLGAGQDVKSNIKVVGTPDGGFLLGWIDNTDNELSFRGYDKNGNQSTDKKDLPWENTNGEARDLEMSITADGRVAVSWSEYNNNYSNADVYGAIIDTRGGSFTAARDAVSVARKQGGEIEGTGGVNKIYGLGGKDDISGKGGQDKLWGAGNKDKLEGGKGKDAMWGGGGEDVIKGGGGADKLYGGGGDNDKMSGGGGADVFYFKNNDGEDKVMDFGRGSDSLVFDNKLWGGGNKSGQKIVNDHASKDGDDIVFNFGGGDKLILKDYASLGSLDDFIG